MTRSKRNRVFRNKQRLIHRSYRNKHGLLKEEVLVYKPGILGSILKSKLLVASICLILLVTLLENILL